MDDRQLTRIWNQQEIPVIVRRTGKRQLLRVRLAYADTNCAWFQDGLLVPPTLISGKRYREIPKAWFNDFVERALRTFRQVYVIKPIAGKRSAHPPASTLSATNSSAIAWVATTAPATMAAGSKYPRPSRSARVTRSWRVD